ncbi:low temperature requirement protein A [Sphingosinicella rhizophila]|uniref:Low temperature requirement protein A n=1 Tax=Sphingosinicella rhizophila TaxID=3050082 RepID=A0ABU3Q9Z9_9SPHN|nr:low temperature requirement protein A [Sphingosinicella sp. GR2756]MDT9599818.1 low temperature requirement protein A [Sphingosinicella sp. GR2756]
MPRLPFTRPTGPSADHSVHPMELFFDLVFVFAVTQLSHYLLEHHNLAGVLQTLVMFLAVWWAWIYTAWATNWLDPERAPVRLKLAFVMLLGLVLSSAIPQAFGRYGLYFALAYVAIQVSRTFYTAWARGEWQAGSWNMTRAGFYFLAAAPLWIAGGLDADPTRRLLWWSAALAVEYAGPATFFAVPGLGRSTAEDWAISGEHMAERCALFIILSLGEGILVTGATFARLEADGATVAAFVSAFAASVAMWWIYFDTGARRGSDRIEHDSRPGLLGRAAYTYCHIPIVAGIIVLAVADEQVLVHPAGHGGPFLLAALLGGALLFIGGTAAFKRMTGVSGRWPLSHLVGIGMFALLGAWAVAVHPAPLHLHMAATGLFVAIAVWEWGSYHGGWVERWARWRAGRARPTAG